MVEIIKTDNFKILLECFENISALQSASDTRKANHGNYTRESMGESSWSSMMKDFRNGDGSAIKTIKSKIKIDDAKTVQKKRRTTKLDVVGFTPNIPNALMGLPKAMVTTEKRVIKSKILNVLIDIDVKHSITNSQITNYWSEVLAYLIGLEKQGYRTRIELVSVTADADEETCHVMKLLLKSENQPMDVARMVFPITDARMLRKVNFDWYEKLPNAKYIMGYGKALHDWRSKTKADEIKTALGTTNMNAYYLHYRSEYKEILGTKN